MKVLVTIGSTRFDHLTSTTLRSPTFWSTLSSLNVTELVIQHGNAPAPFDTTQEDTVHAYQPKVALTQFAFKEGGLKDDMERADVIISHAGSGSILEALRLRKRLIVAVNDRLMDNHQQELADAMMEEGYLLSCHCETLSETLSQIENVRMKPFPEPQADDFVKFLDQIVS